MDILLLGGSAIPEKCSTLEEWIAVTGLGESGVEGGRNELKLLCRRRFALVCRRLFLFGCVSFSLLRWKQRGWRESVCHRFAVCLHLSHEQPRNIPFRSRAWCSSDSLFEPCFEAAGLQSAATCIPAAFSSCTYYMYTYKYSKYVLRKRRLVFRWPKNSALLSFVFAMLAFFFFVLCVCACACVSR